MTYNIFAAGTCLEDIELLRNNEVYLDALGALRIPDPTIAGDFCRRFHSYHITEIMEIINNTLFAYGNNNPILFLKKLPSMQMEL